MSVVLNGSTSDTPGTRSCTSNTVPKVSVQGVSKRYQVYDRPQDRLKQALSRWRRTYYREFWALKPVSFEVKAGEAMGIAAAGEAPRMLRDDWFEQAIVTYGTLTGVAAVGLMLLRIADPHQRTTAAQAFASRSMVLSPLLGGGIVTATMPLLVMQFGVVPLLVATTVVMLAAWSWPGVSAPSGGSATA